MMGVQATLPTLAADNQLRTNSQMQMPKKLPYHNHIGSSIMPWLNLHFPTNSAFNGRIFIGRKKDGSMCTVSRRNIKEVTYFVSHMHISEHCDYYITANSVNGVARKKEDLFALHNIVIDIDCHTDEAPYQLIANELVARCRRDLFSHGDVPEPNSIVYTGRGVQFWWALEPAAKALVFLYQRAQTWLIEQFEHLIEEYPSSLSDFSVDASASRNLVGYYRLPMTYNTAVGRKGSYELLHTKRHKVTDLVDQFVPSDYSDKKSSKEQLRKQSEAFTLNTPVINLTENDVIVFEGGTNAMGRRILQLVELRAFRNAAISKEMRDLFCFVVYCALLAIHNQEEAWRRLLAFNTGFKVPLDIKELEQSMSAAQDRRYHLTNAWIIEMLKISPEEQIAIGMQSCSKRPSNYTRDLVRQKKKGARNAEILVLHRAGMSQTKIAAEMNLSRNTVAKVLREASEREIELQESIENSLSEGGEMNTADSENHSEGKEMYMLINLKTAQAQTCSNLVPKYSFVSYSDSPALNSCKACDIEPRLSVYRKPPT